MGKEERSTYTIKEDENLGEVKIADEVVAIIAGLAAMEVDVGQAGNHITAAGVVSLAIGTGVGQQAAVKAHIPLDKALLQVKYLSTGYPHTCTPASTSL